MPTLSTEAARLFHALAQTLMTDQQHTTEQHYTIAQVARLLVVSRWTVKRWIESGSLKATNAKEQPAVGRAALRIRASTLNAWLEERSNTPQVSAADTPNVAPRTAETTKQSGQKRSVAKRPPITKSYV